MPTLNINGKDTAVNADDSTPILWALRDTLGMTGTKFGCGQALCGACTVHLNGAPVRSCVTPISAAVGQKITTIEAIAADDKVGKAVHAAWVKHDVAQCGYCQSHGRQRVPLRNVRAHTRRHPRRRQVFGLIGSKKLFWRRCCVLSYW